MPTCTGCGQQEINYVYAAARGWQRIVRALKCGTCIRVFPAWMRANI
jgi:hypothetical protein